MGAESVTRLRDRLIYGLTSLQASWSSTKLRRIVRDKRYARQARNHFYAALLARRRRRA